MCSRVCVVLSGAVPLLMLMTAEHPTDFHHDPVMESEISEIIADLPAGVFADLTLGGAGHAVAALGANSELSLHGFDRDDLAIGVSSQRLSPFGSRVVVHTARFDDAAARLKASGVNEINGFLMDLGVSSPQLDIGERGFSYRLDGPLDMRMDQNDSKTAADIVNTYAPGELLDVLRSYGDERHASRIVDAIMSARPLQTTGELAQLVADAMPAAARRKSTGHPAKRTFQALRIEVNNELAILGDTVESMIDMLAPGGVGLVLTYHSGEDRITKDRMRTAVEGDAPPGMPTTSPFSWFFRGAKTASEIEIERNPRSRSARLRAITRSGERESQ